MKRFLIWSACVLVILIAVAILAFTLSPWPSVALITYAFAKGARASEAALEKHVPSGIVARRDVAYGSGKNETFDLYLSTGRKRASSNNRLGAWWRIRSRKQKWHRQLHEDPGRTRLHDDRRRIFEGLWNNLSTSPSRR